jgi:hypothetical protein
MTNFNELVADETRAKKLIEGSHVHGATYQNWYDQRHFISRAIHRSGTLLYIGCANGFLLRCLLEWLPHKLIPYGIEPLEESVQVAKELLEPFEANMIQAAAEQLPHLSKGRLPGSFDFIQWSFWRNWDYTQPHNWQTFQNVWNAVKPQGRLMLCFYDGELAEMDTRISKLQEHFRKADGILTSAWNKEKLAWFEKE